MIDCTRADELMDDFLDGALSEPLARDLREHLCVCAGCARAETDLRALLGRAAALPAEAAAGRNLWPGIRDRIAADARREPPRARTRSAYWMAAAAAALVVVTSAVTVMVARRQVPPSAQPSAPSAELVSLKTSEPDYIQARKALYAALQERRSRLSPETVKVIDQNLAVMDQALRTMKNALDKDPGNRGLAVLIESTYRQEIQFLMQATSLPTNA